MNIEHDSHTTDLCDYVVPSWIRVRREAFGLLFYDTRTTKLTYVRSGDTLLPPAFGESGPLWVDCRGNGDSRMTARVLDQLASKGLLVPGRPE